MSRHVKTGGVWKEPTSVFVRDNGVYKSPSMSYVKEDSVWKEIDEIVGEDIFTTQGTHTWTAPSGVYSISVVCVGGGAYGYETGGKDIFLYGGGGGALAYANAVPVVPGDTYTITVGGGGNHINGFHGADSSFESTVIAGGGKGGTNPAGGVVISGDGGGSGGRGGTGREKDLRSGGGGAGGYSGNGGKGGDGSASSSYYYGASGSGGGGGGGGGGRRDYVSGGYGGGVRVHGQGSSGAGGVGGTVPKNGSAGSADVDPVSRASNIFGAGAASGELGIGGAVRIIYPGSNRQFPSTRTEDEA